MTLATLSETAPARGVVPAPMPVGFPREHVPPDEPPTSWTATADLWHTIRRSVLGHFPVVVDDDIRCGSPVCGEYFPCSFLLTATEVLGTPTRQTLYAIASQLRQRTAEHAFRARFALAGGSARLAGSSP
jgi:hypothetical protein